MEPKVSIILATYNPRIDWFESFLDSINDQDYPNYDLVVLDDCSTSIDIKELETLIKKHVNKVPIKVIKNKKNLGSIKSFEALLSLTDAEYVAFADQDDIWHKDKLSKCVTTLINGNKKMTYSDVNVIDGDGKIVSNSITTFRKRFIFYDEEEFEHLIYKNYVIGCTIVINREFALKSIPFLTSIFHDQYLALFASYHNELIRTKESLIDYRIHQDNQTNPLGKVKTKEDYYNENILKFYDRVTELNKLFKNKELDRATEWANARIGNYQKDKDARNKLKEMKDINPNTTKFDLYILHKPLLFKLVVGLAKRNKI